MNASPQMTMRHSASPAHSHVEKAQASPAASSLIRNSDVLISEMGLAGIGIVTAQPGTSTQNLPQVAPQNALSCSTCNEFFEDSIMAKCNDIDQHFCSGLCLLRYEKVANLRKSSPAPATEKFHCEICSLSYSYKNTLKRHFLAKHPGQIFNDNIVASMVEN